MPTLVVRQHREAKVNTKSDSRVGLVTLAGLYLAGLAGIAVVLAVVALANVDWDTRTLSQMVIVLFVLVGGLFVAVVYLAAARRE